MLSKPLIIVGTGWAGRAIATAIAEVSPEKICGFVDERLSSGSVSIECRGKALSYPVLGEVKHLLALAKAHGARSVVVAAIEKRSDCLLEQLARCYDDDIIVQEMSELYSKMKRKIPVKYVNHHWIVPALTSPRDGVYGFFYDTVNVICGLLGVLLIFFPLLPIIAFLIKLTSSGPIFFRQIRVGKKGRHYKVIKFRSMVKDAENGRAVWAASDDQRVTKIGRLLRKFRIDEIPQFINLVKGEMALVGPRPERPEFVEGLSKEIPFYDYRHVVKPGITGWAQVNYPYGNSVKDALEKIQYDLYWIKHRSVWLDLNIIFKSFKVVFTGYGAL